MTRRIRILLTLLVLLGLVAVPLAARAGSCCTASGPSCCDQGGCPPTSTPTCGLEMAVCVEMAQAPAPVETAPTETVPAPFPAPAPPGAFEAPPTLEPRAPDPVPRPRSPRGDGRLVPFATVLPPPALGA